MTIRYFILFCFLQLSVFGQQIKIEGLVLDKRNNDALAFTNVEFLSSKGALFSTQTDFDGKFTFANLPIAVYEIRLKVAGYVPFDSIIRPKASLLVKIKLPVDTTVVYYYGFENNEIGAKKDIKNNDIKLWLPGGFISSAIFEADGVLEKKYNFKFASLGCVRSERDDLIGYNQVIFAYLDKTYGKIWRKEVRQDVIGLNK